MSILRLYACTVVRENAKETKDTRLCCHHFTIGGILTGKGGGLPFPGYVYGTETPKSIRLA